MRGRIDGRQFEEAWAATERFRDQLEEAGPEPDDAAGLEENS